jgi:hypothetical protein
LLSWVIVMLKAWLLNWSIVWTMNLNRLW